MPFYGKSFKIPNNENFWRPHNSNTIRLNAGNECFMDKCMVPIDQTDDIYEFIVSKSPHMMGCGLNLLFWCLC